MSVAQSERVAECQATWWRGCPGDGMASAFHAAQCAEEKVTETDPLLVRLDVEGK